jgi:hypothetical protein
VLPDADGLDGAEDADVAPLVGDSDSAAGVLPVKKWM